MATSITPIRSIVIRASSNSDPSRRPTTSSANWWTPLFGFSSDQINYIETTTSTAKPSVVVVVDTKKSTRSPSAGRLTSEKARQLRILTSETSTFHDVMYHSAIASRLASDFSHNNNNNTTVVSD
ncbi:uncharacterized protein LOC124911653 [Impatiens glandulifera]|uniref:uncharacterized protein LOC124911653 n=1 Tax=Impatiens glandulifera TaxID=253017 RepID=UPI001FB0828E|nr:uncharacterized protein LOC124911653 [Impatiens glandulifera]